MALFMDVHTIEGGVVASDVAAAHEADLETQARFGVRYLRYWVDEDDWNDADEDSWQPPDDVPVPQVDTRPVPADDVPLAMPVDVSGAPEE